MPTPLITLLVSPIPVPPPAVPTEKPKPAVIAAKPRVVVIDDASLPKEPTPKPSPKPVAKTSTVPVVKPDIFALVAHSKTTLRLRNAPSSRARVRYVSPANKALLVLPFNEDWTKVRMNDGSMAYAPTSGLRMSTMAYERVGSATAANRVNPNWVASRGGRVVRGSRESLPGAAFKYIGTPYVWGGNDMIRGVDCSAFVKNLYGKIGLGLPRTAAEQARVGIPITRFEDLKAGDRLYFWETKRNKIGHTGMYIGEGFFIHSASGRGVTTDYLTPRWQRDLVAARR